MTPKVGDIWYWGEEFSSYFLLTEDMGRDTFWAIDLSTGSEDLVQIDDDEYAIYPWRLWA